MIDLAAAAKVDSLITDWRAAIGRGARKFGSKRRTASEIARLGARLRYLSSESDLLRHRTNKKLGHGMLAMGDPRFDTSFWGSESGRSGLRALPFSEREVLSAHVAWRDYQRSSGENVALFLGQEASEANFKQHAPGKAMIHIATHSLFIGAKDGGAKGSIAGHEHDPEHDHELVRNGDTEAENPLVCSGGLGRLHAEQELLGLRRSFLLAGAENMLVSLWPIGDSLGPEWSEAFYGEHLGGRREVGEACRRANLEMLHRRRAMKQAGIPAAWLRFIPFNGILGIGISDGN